jgi:ribonucleoside-diphosphate reductase alpha chain
MSKMVPMESGGFNSASQLAHIISKVIRDRAEVESVKLGQERGIPECGGNKRNATLIAIAPNANSSIICQTSASIEPIKANIYVHRTRVGSHVVKNKYLDKLIEDKGLEKDVVWMEILANKGSIQTLDYFTEFEKKVFKTADEIDMRYVVDQARIRQPFVDQSSSLNVFFKEGVSKKHVSDVHLRAFSRDPELPGEPLKTMYYLRAAKNARIENVSGKIVRHELKDYVSQETDKGIDLVEADKEECLSCQG